MSKILIVGNSLAAAKTIEDIRQKDAQSEITLFCTESLLPYDRLSLPALVAGQIKESKVHPLPDNFFKQHKVEVVANEKLVRISFKRKYLSTESKMQISFDQIMIADLGAVVPLPVKGHQKKGVFDCTMLSSVKALIKYLPYTDTAYVIVSNVQGLNIACALHGHGKEVVIVTSDNTLLSSVLDEETGTLLKQILEGKGLRVVTNNMIEEILGDAEIKAVRLQSGKVAAAQMVVADFLPLDWRLIEEGSEFQKIEDDFFTTALPLKPSHFGFNVLEGFCMGITKLPQGGREYLKFDGPQNIFKKIFAQGDVLVGAVLFNASSHEQSLLKTINDRVSIVGQEEALLGGQG
jgi:NAD(P)H-nitrite reductase large subunit